MKYTFVALALASAAQATSVQDGLEVTAGIIFGITQEEHLTTLNECMVGADTFADDVIKGTEWIIEWDLRSVIVGARAISRAINNLPTYVEHCEQSGEDLAALKEWSSIFLQPANLVQTIAGNAMNHLPKISVDVTKAKRALARHEYFKFGDEMGKVIALLTEPLTAYEL